MMRKVGLVILATGFVVACSAPFSMAAEKKADKKIEKTVEKKQEPKKEQPQTRLVNQGDYARWLVQVLGLSRFVPPTPTDHECFAILLQNGVVPKEGWSSDQNVTKAVLARTVVQAMGKADEVKNPEDDQSWIDCLSRLGIEIGTVGQAVENLEPIEAPLAAEAVVVTTDPLAKQAKFRPIDEQQVGPDLSTITAVFNAAGLEVPPPPMTPN